VRVGKEAAMYTNYYFSAISRRERELLEMVLLEEMDIQSWFAVAYCGTFGGEILLTLQ
jgi:hypothetical protein